MYQLLMVQLCSCLLLLLQGACALQVPAAPRVHHARHALRVQGGAHQGEEGAPAAAP
jgi:hypothetical protein